MDLCLAGTPEVPEDQPLAKGVGRINTLWGSCIQVVSLLLQWREAII